MSRNMTAERIMSIDEHKTFKHDDGCGDFGQCMIV